MTDLSKKRLSDFKKTLKNASLDGYLTVNHLEQRYFSGIDLSDGEAVFLLTPSKVYCVTKEMIVSKMEPAKGFIKTEAAPTDMFTGALEKIKQLGLKTVAFDPALVDFERGQLLAKAKLVTAPGLVGEQRVVKYEDEIAKIKKSCKIAFSAFADVQPQIKTGMTEEDVRVLMAVAMTKRGADSVPFNIVCFGANAADAHHTPSKTRKLKNNEPVLMDFGCFYEGYASDMTRSWWHGDHEPEEYTKIWNIVDKARKAAVKFLKAGVSCAGADAAARDIIERAGYGKNYFHSTGHGIGLVVHDRPLLGPRSVAALEAGSVVTVEPGIYFPGKWGIRLEDSFLVTKTGSVKLTKN